MCCLIKLVTSPLDDVPRKPPANLLAASVDAKKMVVESRDSPKLERRNFQLARLAPLLIIPEWNEVALEQELS
jgi:hypothetical protein